ncbi:MAG TPA: hypothetical protein VGR37_08905 [Longimicrobiaceae bacterium]|nr:hypothetical protein [Longimicrobiaceae bacterium]
MDRKSTISRIMSEDSKSADELQEHMLGTYDSLRTGLWVIGAALPLIVLFAGGILHHVWFEPSVSDYYHTDHKIRFFTTRDFFVGGLLAVGACLYLYKGFSTRENVALNLAGGLAAVVALFPNAGSESDDSVSVVHATAAVLFFLCLAYVSVFRSRDTLRLLPPDRRPHYAQRYVWTGMAMFLMPLTAVVLSYVMEPLSPFRTVIFWVETAGVWAFAWYWRIKTREMRESRAEKRGLDAELQRDLVPATPAAAGGVGGASGAVLRTLSPKSGQVERIVPVERTDGSDSPAPDTLHATARARS